MKKKIPPKPGRKKKLISTTEVMFSTNIRTNSSQKE